MLIVDALVPEKTSQSTEQGTPEVTGRHRPSAADRLRGPGRTREDHRRRVSTRFELTLIASLYPGIDSGLRRISQ